MSSSHALPIVPQKPQDALSAYALDLLRMRPQDDLVDPVLREMEDLAEREGIPIIGPLEGAILQMLLRLLGKAPQRALDIGTAIGYSAIWMAQGLPPQTEIVSIELDPERVKLARKFIRQAGLEDRIRVLQGDVFQLLPDLGTFDVIFQDVIKHVYFAADSHLALRLLDLCLEHLKPGGLLLGDNVFCLGEAYKAPDPETPPQVLGIKAYNQRVATHPDLESVVIPVRDGLWVSVKRSTPS